MEILIIILIWLPGFLLCRWMLKVDHFGKNNEATNGQLVLLNVLAIISWFLILIMLVRAWIETQEAYWKKTANPQKDN